MKIYSIVIFRCFYDKTGTASKQPVLACAAHELSSFGYFQRGSVKEVAVFVSREVVGRSQPGQKQSIQHKEHYCHSLVTINNVGAAALTDGEYPARVAYSLLQKCIDEFMNTFGAKFDSINSDTELSVEKIDKMLLEYQDPSKADSVMRIQKDLDETKEVLVKSIDQLLDRGEKLETLAQKSDGLSIQSKLFLQNAEKWNSCCTII